VIATHFSFLYCSLCNVYPQASANSGGGSASASAGAATTPLEPFIVNLSTFDRYLQMAITLQLASLKLPIN
jgi:flagellar basal body-associated protein FliL